MEHSNPLENSTGCMVTQICTMASRVGGVGGWEWHIGFEGNGGVKRKETRVLIIRENGIVLYLAHFYM